MFDTCNNPHCWETIHRLLQYERDRVTHFQDEISELKGQMGFDRMVMNRMRDDNTEFQNEIDNLKKENRQLKESIHSLNVIPRNSQSLIDDLALSVRSHRRYREKLEAGIRRILSQTEADKIIVEASQ